MDKPERNEPSRSGVDGRSSADLLRERISRAQQDPKLRFLAPDLIPVLGMVEAYITRTEARLALLEKFCDEPYPGKALK